jgi:hypothetical protein
MDFSVLCIWMGPDRLSGNLSAGDDMEALSLQGRCLMLHTGNVNYKSVFFTHNPL